MKSDRHRLAGNSPVTAAVGGFGKRPSVLRKRFDFVRASKSSRYSTPGFNIQARKRSKDENHVGVRVGYTCSKKVGHAVARNRAKRRLREIARIVLSRYGQAGWDYVLIGRPETTDNRAFDALCVDLNLALEKLHSEQS